MNPIPRSALILIASVIVMLTTGLVALVWGRRIRRGDLLGWAGVSGLVIGAGISFAERAEDGFVSRSWYRGWIWPREEAGAIPVGVIESPLGLWMILLVAALSAALLLTRPVIAREPRSERIFAAIGISTAGTALSWISVTPWLAFAGIALTVLGGFIALGSRWPTDAEAALATRYAWERSWGLILSMIGAAGLTATRAAESWMGSAGWGNGIELDLFSAGLLVFGLAVQFQPFPFFSWAVSPTEALPSVRAILVFGFPAASAFAVLVRLEPQLRALELMPVAGWAFLASSILAVATGTLQSLWRAGHATWMSAGMTLSAAVLCFSGPSASIPVFSGFLLGACALAFNATALAVGGAHSQANKNRAVWAKATGWTATGAASGMVGFVTCGGALQWLAQAWPTPGQAVVFAVTLFLVGFLGWKLMWDLARVDVPVQLPWSAVLAPFLPLFLSLGVVWTGTITGGAVPGSFDQFLKPLINALVPGSFPWSVDEAVFLGTSWTYWLSILAAIGAGAWVSSFLPAWTKARSGAGSYLLKFISRGYGFEALAARVLNLLVVAGNLGESLIDRKIWRGAIPEALSRTAQSLALVASRMDRVVSDVLRSTARVSVDAPAKALQVLQSGDVQWYLLFGVGSGLALLLHFSRN